jgi:hypothetical protein
MGIDKVVQSLEPNQRVLRLIFNKASPSADNAIAYLYYPVWYQAERHGLTNFNFAWFTPQIARYRPEYRPAITIGFDFYPELFSWSVHHGSNYGYFFVRGASEAEQNLFRGAPCRPKLVAHDGSWRVFRAGHCAPKKVNTNVPLSVSVQCKKSTSSSPCHIIRAKFLITGS